MTEFNYTLIISQYRHSRHQFIVKFNGETFLENAKKFVTELENYKRSEDVKAEIELGDLTYRKQDTISSRYNINDRGDIYFINSKSANRLNQVAIEYYEQSRREAIGFKRKGVEESIGKHHDFWIVKAILEKHFEIA